MMTIWKRPAKKLSVGIAKQSSEGAHTQKNATIKAFERIKGKSPADVQKRVAIIENAPINDVLHYRDENGQTLLHEYYSLPDEAPIVRAIIRKCGTADIRNSDGATPLHYSVRSSRLSMFTLLLDGGADVNATDNAGRTPVMKMYDECDILKVLVDSGRCNFDARCHKGRTALYYLTTRDEPNFARRLLPHMKDPSNIDVTALMACLAKGCKGNGLARDILQHLKDDAPLGRIGDEEKGFTPFQLALRKDLLVSTFLENAFVQKRYRDYMAVHYLKEAVTYGKMEQLKGILKGYTEYMRGCTVSQTDFVLENINYRPVGGRHCPLNVLCCALSPRFINDDGSSQGTKTDMVRLLLEHGANPNGLAWPVPSLAREGDLTKQNASLKSYEKPPATKGSEAADNKLGVLMRPACPLTECNCCRCFPETKIQPSNRSVSRLLRGKLRSRSSSEARSLTDRCLYTPTRSTGVYWKWEKQWCVTVPPTKR